MVMEKKLSECYFKRPCTVWFPDFEEMMESREKIYKKYRMPFEGGISMLRYFRGEVTRDQFVSQFMEQQAPEKIMSRDRELYRQVRELCTAFQQKMLCPAEFDEQVLLCFRSRPAEGGFVPAAEEQKELLSLISRLERKSGSLPIDFDGIAWQAYLSGKLTREMYAESFLNFGAGEHLAQRTAYGIGKEDFLETYNREISACLDLRRLCIEYRQGVRSAEYFDAEFVKLANQFCLDIPK